jgi:hypothetical protein
VEGSPVCSEKCAWGTVRCMCGVVVGHKSVQKVDSFLVVFVHSQSYYYFGKTEIIWCLCKRASFII